MTDVLPDLSISIVNTNNRDVVRDCLHSIGEATHRIRYEILVVDNASTDGSAAMIQAEFPEVVLLRNEHKLGFSTNHNKALAQAKGRYVLILNDDVIVLDGALDQLVEFMDNHPEAGATGPKFLNPDGTNQPAFASFGTPFSELVVQPWRRWFSPGRWDLDKTTAVDSVGGACMLVRREAAQQVGLLDTAFDPLYAEERDWCYRISRRGWQIYHVPRAKIVHMGGQTRKRASEFMTKTMYRNKLRFYRKHYGRWHVLSYRLLLTILCFVKATYWALVCLLRPRGRSLGYRRLTCHMEILTQVALGRDTQG